MRAIDTSHATALADMLQLHLTFESEAGFTLSHEDMEMIVAALRFTATVLSAKKAGEKV